MAATTSPATDTDRLDAAVEEAELAFWAVIAEAYPEAQTGDFPFDAAHAIEQSMRAAAKRWIELNAQ